MTELFFNKFHHFEARVYDINPDYRGDGELDWVICVRCEIGSEWL